MLKFVSGDLLQTDAHYIAQGVAEGNQEGLGTGLAFKISKKWPKVQTAFKNHARSGRFKGGDAWLVDACEEHPGVIYLATQPDMYHATLPYLRRALKNLVKLSESKQLTTVAMPKIGAGLGKLSWESEVKPLLIELLSSSNCSFVVYEQFTNNDEQGTVKGS